jgi:protein-S-isoprenylcysteine O-methyltransferase Ste14
MRATIIRPHMTAAARTPAPPTRLARRRAIAWGGALAFAAALLSCGATYVLAMARPATGRAETAVAVDLLLFTAFALHHSVFARAGVRAWVERHVPAGLERSAYVWVASVLLILLCVLWQAVPGTVWHLDGAAAILLRAIQVASVVLTLVSAASIDIWELAGVRQVAADPKPVVFKEHGPYGWVRHPIYTGWFGMVFADPLMTGTRLTFALVSGLYLLIAIPFEERSLRASTGGAYARYATTVRWKLVPGLY